MKIENDDMAREDFYKFLIGAFKSAHEALRPGGAYYVWYASKCGAEFMNALRENNMEPRQQIIWVKNHFVLSRQDYQWKHEPCLYGWKEGQSHYFIDDRTLSTIYESDMPDLNAMKKNELVAFVEGIYEEYKHTTVIYEDKPKCDDIHPTMKPVKLIARQITNSSKKGDKVIDLFGGSGTTLIACEQLGRTCYMMEYDPKYADAIIARWEQLTNKTAVKING